jgi:hypothetical protein
MTRPNTLIRACCVVALTQAAPLAAQAQPGGFQLPPSSPTPTPAPEGPADERAGVVIPPRNAPAPQIRPVPVLTPEPEIRLPRQTEPVTPQPSAPRPAASSGTGLRPALAPAASPTANTPVSPERAITPAPGDPLALPPSRPLPLPLPTPEATPSAQNTPADTVSTLPALPQWWPWAAGGLGGLIALGLSVFAWRRRKPKVLHLAAPPSGMGGVDPRTETAPEPSHAAALAIDLALEITGATRSVMMFTLHYRLTIANRSGQAVNDANLALLLACARAGANNAAAPGAAQQLEQIARIGPHQNLPLTGSVQLPLSQITPLHQGRTPLLIPLVHITLEAEGQSAVTRRFVIGTPSAIGTGRLHPIPLSGPPGSINGLAAQRIAVPTAAVAA